MKGKSIHLNNYDIFVLKILIRGRLNIESEEKNLLIKFQLKTLIRLRDIMI